MNANDIPFPVVDSRPLCIELRRGDGQYWEWKGGYFAANPGPLDPTRFALPLVRDATNPELQIGIIPAAATRDPSVCVIQCVQPPGGKRPIPDQAWWLGPYLSGLIRITNRDGMTIPLP